MKDNLPSSGVVVQILYNSIRDEYAQLSQAPLNRVKHYTHVMKLCGCSMHACTHTCIGEHPGVEA